MVTLILCFQFYRPINFDEKNAKKQSAIFVSERVPFSPFCLGDLDWVDPALWESLSNGYWPSPLD